MPEFGSGKAEVGERNDSIALFGRQEDHLTRINTDLLQLTECLTSTFANRHSTFQNP